LENDGGSNGGGAIFNWDCPAVIVTNCTFSKNDGGSSGGGAIYNYHSSAFVTNCILWNDSAGSGSEIHNEGGALTISHSDIAGGVAGIVNTGGGTIYDDGTNIEVDPLFAATYHLQADSECIDKGTTSAPGLPSTDIDAETRVQGANCDLGADEFQDSDTDGMPDWWEIIYGVDEPNNDSDIDGLSNLEEYKNNSNPKAKDSDSDGLWDYDEGYIFFTDPGDPNTDYDGVGDGAEVDLAWDANTEKNLAGYIVYIGEKSRYDPSLDPAKMLKDLQDKNCGADEKCRQTWVDFCSPPDLLCDSDYYKYDAAVDVGNVTEYRLTLPDGVYFFAVTSYDTTYPTRNHESKFSVELMHTIDSTKPTQVP
jgi:hypothetical protein